MAEIWSSEGNMVDLILNQDVLARLDKTDQAFFARVQRGETAGFPRVQPGTRDHSFT
jgi:hypothetical protein